jgi:uncharacterized protein (TIGR02246 family)
MSPQTPQPQDAQSSEEGEIRALYERILTAWNNRDGDSFAAQFTEDGTTIGFDGSEHTGRAGIAADMKRIFADHPTGRYVWKIRGVRSLGADAGILRAVSALVPAGQSDLNAQTNALQTLVAVKRDGHWRIALFQNTPAQYHGRPELAEQLTNELRQLL